MKRTFRSLKMVDLKARPIHHRTADRVCAHILLCMLAYCVEWHMREAWRKLMSADTDQAAKAMRDPVAPAQRSKAALGKLVKMMNRRALKDGTTNGGTVSFDIWNRRALENGTPIHSFAILMANLNSLARNTCRTPSASTHAPTFDIKTIPIRPNTAR
ncbi:MAG: hypothetical protein LBQ20_12410 [Rhodanobacter sp.]|nr:hypothetical protein [Rhodanobacter sp.]